MYAQRVLYATDFSPNAENALPYLQRLVEMFKSEVHVLYVIPDWVHHEPWYGEFDPEHGKKIIAWEREQAEKRLEKICHNYLEGCPLYIKHVAVGDPADEILKLAAREDIDLIVMPTRGRSGQFSFGGVAEKIVRSADIPVVTIPGEKAG